MRRVLVIALSACGFQHGALGTSDATDASGATDATDGSIDARIDGQMTGNCGGKIWFADFSSDPTTYDNNLDGTNDWKYRTGSFPTSQLAGGEWLVPSTGFPPLDTQPDQDFSTRIFAHMRMRGTGSAGNRGAVLYFNVGNTASSFITFLVDVKLNSPGSQTVRLVNIHGAGSTETEIASIAGFDAAPVTVDVVIDPSVPNVTYNIGTQSATLSLQNRPGMTVAKWISATAYSTPAAFDELRLEVCP